MCPFLMYLRVLLLIVGLRSLGVQGKQYECGEHGRFEYCVDGVPGCVVGCHCHPGYYFDTDTKICEPNSKLVHGYRRLYLSEPTRVHIPVTPAYEIDVAPTVTTLQSPLDSQVDQALAKDTDDIGDWLYNQFFKTIENQVLNSNSTNTEESNKNQTRRSGSSTSKKSKRKKLASKKIKFSKISNKDDLRRKLLRITEDDSLFNSDSDSATGDDSRSTSDSDSSDTSLDTDDTSGPKEKHHPDDKEHGHRKILVVNKKPKPPLPSFIFLPNLETPFYPPIGLPPPPPIPMYPMVPVPPMPFPFTMIIPTESTGNGKTKAPKTTTAAHRHTTHKHTTHTTAKPGAPDVPGAPDAPDAPDASKAPASTTTKMTTPETGIESTTKNETTTIATVPDVPGGGRTALRSRMRKKKLFRQFRERHPGPFIPFDNRKASAQQMPPINPLMPSISDYMDMPDQPMVEELPPEKTPPPVDFKYLSQLIHKMNSNKPHEDDKHHKVPLPKRRFDTQYYGRDPEVLPGPLPPAIRGPPPPPPPEPARNGPPDADESYYANLGQQIASLIRKLDNAAPQSNPNTPKTHIEGDNGYASRSYWERSVRSLFSHYPPSSNDINFLRNEENLLSLENKVKVVATTQRSWNLNELENVFFLVDKIKSQLHNIKGAHKENLATQTKVTQPPKPPSRSADAENLNVNLLPRQTDLLLSERRAHGPIPERRNMHEPLFTAATNETHNKTSNRIEDFLNSKNIHYNLRGILMQNFKNIFKTDYQKQPHRQSHKYAAHNETNSNRKSIPNREGGTTHLRKLIRMDQLESMLQKHHPPQRQRAQARPKHEGRRGEMFVPNVKAVPKPSGGMQPLLSYKNTALHPSHHNKYIFENDALAFQLAPAQTDHENAYYPQVPHNHNYFD